MRILLPAVTAGLLAGALVSPLSRGGEAALPQATPSRPEPAQTAPAPAPAPAAGPPEVRIGLTTDPLQARFYASGGLAILHPDKPTAVWKPRFDEPVVVVLDLPRGITPRSVFRVQTGSFTSEAEAEAMKARLERLVPDPVIISYNPDRNSYRVRVGQFERREDAASLTDRLLEEGFVELWVAEEAAPASGKARLRLVDSRYYSQLTDLKSLRIAPVDPAGKVEVNGQPYRGRMEVRILGDGLKVINRLGIEEYLRGVIPNEMGPVTYPELEALKAQAVAARTYVVANRGQFSDSGYDICDSPSCQVYRGSGTEHPLTDQALEETAGIIAGFNGSPIKALYTSTCGGHTEDGVNVFTDLKLPYLKGVECYPEATEVAVLIGREDLPAVELGVGALVSAEVGFLFVSGVVGEEVFHRKYLQEEASPPEVLGWWRKAFGLIGTGNVPAGFRFARGDLLEWSRFLIQAFGWTDRARMVLADKDLPYLLDSREAGQVPPGERLGVAFLLSEGILRPAPDGTLRVRGRPSRGMVLDWVYRITDRYRSLPVQQGVLHGVANGTIQVGGAGQVETLLLAQRPLLYRAAGRGSVPAPRLAVAVGDSLTYHLDSAGKVDAVLVSSPWRGVSDDRSSAYYRWEVRTTRQELEDLIRKRVDLGRLGDVIPTKRGVSGRVIQVKIVGSRGTFTLNGFKIRTALGLRENLFTIERQIDPGGGIRAFIFTGKGWGHGVGLCQVGAYGMAQRGESFDRILKHYYAGIELVRAY